MVLMSMVLPVYNVEKYLGRCVDSIVESCGSEYKDEVEVVLVDDGSTDGSGKLCDEIRHRYQDWICVRVVHKENGGLASARNRGVEESSGKYISFIDSDDWIERDFVKSIRNIIKEYDPDIIKFGYNRIENKKKVFSKAPYIREGLYQEGEMKQFNLQALGNGSPFENNRKFIMSACMAVYRAKIIKDCNLIFHSEREILNEDILFNLEFLLKAKSAYVLHAMLYNYDCREFSLTQRYKPRMYERKCAMFSYYDTIFRNSGLLDEEGGAERYSQFFAEHMYDCMVMEIQWNYDRKSRLANIQRVMRDPNFKKAQSRMKTMRLSLKARIMLMVFSSENAWVFDALYRAGHKMHCLYEVGRTYCLKR